VQAMARDGCGSLDAERFELIRLAPQHIVGVPQHLPRSGGVEDAGPRRHQEPNLSRARPHASCRAFGHLRSLAPVA
jgi:hypothetical protein